jgi:predicted Zn-dependent peptidase
MKIIKKILKNGVTLVMVPLKDNPSATVLVMVETGSEYESKEISGISHFLEHMVFKGTKKRPSNIDISRELDQLGANYNAFTGQEYTGYYAKADKKHIKKIIDIVSDMYMNPIFDHNEIEKEKGVILEELRMYKDLPQRHVHDLNSELLFGDQPAGAKIIGREETIRSFTREDIINYRKDHYVGRSTVVVVSGSFNQKQVEKDIHRAFSKISLAPKKAKEKVIEHQLAPAIKIENKDTDQIHLVISFRTMNINDKRIPTMNVLTNILAGGMSSRLFHKMRDTLGICYYVRAYQDSFTDHGHLAISAGVDKKRIPEAITGILEECKRLKEELVSKSELRKVKDHMIGSMVLGLETSDSVADFVAGQQILEHKIKKPEEIIKQIEKVKDRDIQILAKEIFTNDRLNFCAVGMVDDGIVRPILSV